MARGDRVKLENPDWCKNCGICVLVCPTDILVEGSDRVEIVDLEKCIGCKNCELICPDFVLKVVGQDEN
jgi:2-oxoglutarate ferredoxin oxidoreductase subunit delta